VPRRATEADLDAAAQAVADAMTSFIRAHPTQWLHFGD
jgi:KDO2-lipid IV(A) lauroyltransferase